MNNRFIATDRDREILEYGLIIGNLITEHQIRDAGSISFTDGWACDFEMAEWAEQIIDEWVNSEQGYNEGQIPEHYFTEFVQRKLEEAQKEFSHE